MLSKIMLLMGLMVSTAAYASVVVPEPESLSLIAIGLGLIGVIVVRKR